MESNKRLSIPDAINEGYVELDRVASKQIKELINDTIKEASAFKFDPNLTKEEVEPLLDKFLNEIKPSPDDLNNTDFIDEVNSKPNSNRLYIDKECYKVLVQSVIDQVMETKNEG